MTSSYNHPMRHMPLDRMTAWACVNAILAYCEQPPALFGEWRDATEGERGSIDPVTTARRIQTWRSQSVKAA